MPKKAYFRKITAKKGSKSFWNAIKPFFTNREIITNDSITLEENGVLKNDPKETTEVFNNYYINIVETTSGKRPFSIGNPNFNHCILQKSSQCCNRKRKRFFDLPPASKKDINKMLKLVNANKATRPDGIPLKIIKLSANVVD